MPGASGHVSAAHIYNVAAKDGTVIGSTTPGVITDPLWAGDAGRAKFKYDPTKLVHLGSAQAATYNCYVRADAPVKTIQDVYHHRGDPGRRAAKAARRATRRCCSTTCSAPNSASSPAIRARARSWSRWSATRCRASAAWAGMRCTASARTGSPKGFIRVLVQENLGGNPMFDKMGVPRSVDLAKTPEARQIIELAYTQQAFGRPYILPPGTPADRVAALRKAFMAATQTPELLAEADKMRVEVRPLSGEDIEALVNKMYSLPREIVDRTRDALTYKPPK